MTCPAICEIGDDYGDNVATMHCQLPEGHTGPHRELFRRGRCLILWHETNSAIEGQTPEAMIDIAAQIARMEAEDSDVGEPGDMR